MESYRWGELDSRRFLREDQGDWLAPGLGRDFPAFSTESLTSCETLQSQANHRRNKQWMRLKVKGRD